MQSYTGLRIKGYNSGWIKCIFLFPKCLRFVANHFPSTHTVICQCTNFPGLLFLFINTVKKEKLPSPKSIRPTGPRFWNSKISNMLTMLNVVLWHPVMDSWPWVRTGFQLVTSVVSHPDIASQQIIPTFDTWGSTNTWPGVRCSSRDVRACSFVLLRERGYKGKPKNAKGVEGKIVFLSVNSIHCLLKI